MVENKVFLDKKLIIIIFSQIFEFVTSALAEV